MNKFTSVFVVIAMFGVLMPTSTFAITVFPLESFGTTVVADIPNWEEEGDDTDWTTYATTSSSGNDSVSPNGGAFAKIAPGEWICATVNATSREGLKISYNWRGDSDAEENNDDGIVEFKVSGNCTDSSGWTNINNHDLKDDNSWFTVTNSNIHNSADNSTFKLRFRAVSETNEYFRVDGIQITDSSNYAVSVTDTDVSGLTLTLTGAGEGTPYVGQLSAHNVQINWGNGVIDDTSTTSFTDPSGGPKNFTGTWTNAITYATSGIYTIIVKLYHQNVPGNESSGDSTITFEVNIPAPDTDADDDTINDNDDNCVNDANVGQEDQDGDDIGDACDEDVDGDEVGNDDDDCPSTPGELENGCDPEDTEEACEDTIDNDGDDSIDLLDSDCEEFVEDPEPEVCPPGTIGAPPACVPIGPIDACPLDEGFQAAGPCSSDDVCPNDEGIQTNEGDCTPETQEDVDLCPEEGFQTELPCARVDDGDDQSGDDETPAPESNNEDTSPDSGHTNTICDNNMDDDNDGLYDENDPGCENDEDGSETDEDGIGGDVEGTSTCGPILNSYLGLRGHENDPEAVKVVQEFLNAELGLSLEVNGEYNAETIAAVKMFQAKYLLDVLNPWGIDESTGIVYLTTQRMINMISCPGLDLPMPELN